MRHEVVGDLPKSGDATVISDQIVRPALKKASAGHPGTLRLVTALVEVDGKQVTMQFVTNNFAWSARTIAELYRARWAIGIKRLVTTSSASRWPKPIVPCTATIRGAASLLQASRRKPVPTRAARATAPG